MVGRSRRLGVATAAWRYQGGETPTHLWNADDADFVAMVDDACDLLAGPSRSDEFHDEICQRIQPWNSAGLMNRSSENRYARTAVKGAP